MWIQFHMPCFQRTEPWRHTEDAEITCCCCSNISCVSISTVISIYTKATNQIFKSRALHQNFPHLVQLQSLSVSSILPYYFHIEETLKYFFRSPLTHKNRDKFQVNINWNASCWKQNEDVRGRTTKFANSSRWECYIPHRWIPPWSPSMYSPWEATHRCQRLVHPSKQFWNWFCGMTFRAAVDYSWCHQCHQNAFLSIFPLPSGTEKSDWGLDPVNRLGVPTQLFV